MFTGLLDRISRTLQTSSLPFTPLGFTEPIDPLTYRLEDVTVNFPTLPPQSAFLGLCEDGYPMLIQLNQPNNGSILIVSDDAAGRTRLAQVMADSACAANQAADFKFTVIYSNEDLWSKKLEEANNRGYLMAKTRATSSKATDWILQLALLAEDRSFGRRQGANLLVILDEADFLLDADNNVRSNFLWLCQNGPHFGIHPLISVSSEVALEMSDILNHIRTRIYGRMPNSSSFQLSGFSGLESESFEEGRQYIVRNENLWIPFWTPRS